MRNYLLWNLLCVHNLYQLQVEWVKHWLRKYWLVVILIYARWKEIRGVNEIWNCLEPSLAVEFVVCCGHTRILEGCSIKVNETRNKHLEALTRRKDPNASVITSCTSYWYELRGISRVLCSYNEYNCGEQLHPLRSMHSFIDQIIFWSHLEESMSCVRINVRHDLLDVPRFFPSLDAWKLRGLILQRNYASRTFSLV